MGFKYVICQNQYDCKVLEIPTSDVYSLMKTAKIHNLFETAVIDGINLTIPLLYSGILFCFIKLEFELNLGLFL